LNFGLDIIDGVGGLNLQGDGLASEGLNKNLHAVWSVFWWMIRREE